MFHMARKHQHNAHLLVATYISLIISYRFAVSQHFGYAGYDHQFFSIGKLLISSSLTFAVIILYGLISRGFYRAVYSVYFVMIYLGQSVYYVFNDTSLLLVVYMLVPLVALYVVQLLDGNANNCDVKLKLSDQLTRFAFVAIAMLMVGPYLKNYRLINPANLLLRDIYATRMAQSGQSSWILDYASSPIARVILPFLFVYSLEYKKRGITVLSLLSLALMFLLTGAVKSILFGFAACIFFYRGDYAQKEERFLKTAVILSILSPLEPMVARSCMIADYIRRVFFVPPFLFETYYSYFRRRPTCFLHSRLSKMLGVSEYSGWIPLMIGERVLGNPGLNANVGIFVEGFISFGAIGVMLASVVFAYIVRYINRRALSPAYFGIFFAYIYVINTSFLETLFVTHGFLFYLVFARFIIPKRRASCTSDRIQQRQGSQNSKLLPSIDIRNQSRAER